MKIYNLITLDIIRTYLLEKFSVNLKQNCDSLKNFSIVLPDSGIGAEINLDNSQKIDFISGIIKSKF